MEFSVKKNTIFGGGDWQFFFLLAKHLYCFAILGNASCYWNRKKWNRVRIWELSIVPQIQAQIYNVEVKLMYSNLFPKISFFRKCKCSTHHQVHFYTLNSNLTFIFLHLNKTIDFFNFKILELAKFDVFENKSKISNNTMKMQFCIRFYIILTF